MSEVKHFPGQQGNIDYIHIDNSRSEHGPPNKRTIFMLHGYGANMRDLAPLASLSAEFKKFNWIFPDAPLKVPIGPMMSGKAWFPIDMEELNKATVTGRFEDLFANHIPEGMAQTGRILKEMIHELAGPEYLLGGFSQGSMMANYLTFEENLNPQALLLLSSTLVAKKKWRERLQESSWRGPIFQSHGESDPVLPVSMARALTALIRESDREVYSIEFKGGHEIPPIVMQQLIEFFRRNGL